MMNEETERDADERTSANGPARKPYSSPALRVYGGLDALTRAVGKTSTISDGGGSFAKSKTH